MADGAGSHILNSLPQLKDRRFIIMMIKREIYMERIRPFIGKDLIKVLTGIRRSGKSVMLELIQEELISSRIDESSFVVYNFSQMKNARLCASTVLYEELEKRIADIDGKAYLFFDEIQEVADWEKCINSCRMDFDCDIYITGSNAGMLSREAAVSLAGRYVEFTIYPFSFAEFLAMEKQQNPSLDTSTAFSSYLAIGGMPFLSNLMGDLDACTQYLKNIYNSIMYKDVIDQGGIQDVDLLERIVIYTFTNARYAFSATSLARYFKSENRDVSHNMIRNYIRACCDAFLFYKVRREDLTSGKLLSANEKYYIVDHGLSEAIYNQNEHYKDKTLENIIFMELLRRGYSVTVGKIDTKEIDFVAIRNKSKIYIQVSDLLDSEEIMEQKFQVYDSVDDSFPKYVVSLDETDFSRNGVRHKNIRDFLLMDHWE